MKKWEILKTRVGYKHPFLRVREDHVKLPNGLEIEDYSIWDSGDTAQVIPLTKDGDFILVEMYKHGLGDVIREFPGGFIDQSEDPAVAAKRELAEETNLVTDKELVFLGNFIHHPSKESGVLYLYLALDCYQQKTSHVQDATEDITVVTLSPTEMKKYIETAKILQTGTAFGYYLARTFLSLK